MAVKSEHYDIKQAAAYLGISHRYLYQLKHYDAGPAVTKGRRGQLFYTKADLDAWNSARKAKKDVAAKKRAAKKGGKGQRLVKNFDQKLKKAA
jgi:hypothetical protein